MTAPRILPMNLARRDLRDAIGAIGERHGITFAEMTLVIAEIMASRAALDVRHDKPRDEGKRGTK